MHASILGRTFKNNFRDKHRRMETIQVYLYPLSRLDTTANIFRSDQRDASPDVFGQPISANHRPSEENKTKISNPHG